MECESYNLNWAEFTSYTSKTFKDLLHNQDFADVTLVCDDDEAIKAHKVILRSRFQSVTFSSVCKNCYLCFARHLFFKKTI